MGYRGTLRSIAAAARRHEREQARQQRRMELEQKQSAKMEAAEQARHEVEMYDSEVESLLSVHKHCLEPIDWREILSRPEPAKPVHGHELERAAQIALDTYQPGFFIRTLKLESWRREKLVNAVAAAKNKEAATYEQACREYTTALGEWHENHTLAEKVLSGDFDAFCEAIRQCDPFSDIHEGGKIEIRAAAGGLLEAELIANSSEVIPAESKTLLASGRVSTKVIPKAQHWKMYQDFICGSVLRIGRELFAVLPIERALVTVVGETLDTSTGELKKAPIVSAVLVRQTMSHLNFARLDCTDALDKFVHNMSFKKTVGFSPVDRATLSGA